jgi:hypothetical protein
VLEACIDENRASLVEILKAIPDDTQHAQKRPVCRERVEHVGRVLVQHAQVRVAEESKEMWVADARA